MGVKGVANSGAKGSLISSPASGMVVAGAEGSGSDGGKGFASCSTLCGL